MPFPTFTPPSGVSLSPGSATTHEPRVLRADFGDGYVQRTGDGLNALSRKLEATFQALTNTEADAILSFFEDRKGYLPFLWTLPGEATPRQWIAKSWRRTFSGKGIAEITAGLEETFDP